MSPDWQALADAKLPLKWRVGYLAALAYYGWLLYDNRELLLETAAPTLLAATLAMVALAYVTVGEYYERYQDAKGGHGGGA